MEVGTIELGRKIARTRRNRVMAVIFGLIAVGGWFVAAVIVIGLVAPNAFGVRCEVSPPFVVLALAEIALFGFLPGVLAVGALSSGVTVHDGMVIIENPIRTHRIPVGEVDRFDASYYVDLYGSEHPTVALCRRDGRTVPVWSLSSDFWLWGFDEQVDSWRPVAKELSALVEMQPSAISQAHATAPSTGREPAVG